MHRTAPDIGYFYENRKLSKEAVAAVFRYLSIISGLRFRVSKENALIWSSETEDECPNALIKIAGEVDGDRKTCSRRNSAGDWSPSLEYDPVQQVAKMLSASFELGPFSDKKYSPSDIDAFTLSGLASGFVGLLADAGIISRERQGIGLWPAPHNFALALTHDIDIARRTIRGGIRLLGKSESGGFGGLLDTAWSGLAARPNPYDAVGLWINAEQKIGLKSTFYVFAGHRTHLNDPKYKLGKLRNAFSLIRQGGSEIALHSGIGCFRGDGIANAKSELENQALVNVNGLRPHYLSATLPEYWKAAQAAAFSYSSTLGFDSDIGHLYGIDLPYFPFDAAANRSLELLEIPITIMDCGLIGDQSAESDRVFERGASLIEKASRTGALIVLDWHQRTFYNRDYPGWADLCLRLVRYASDLDAYLTSMGEIVALFKARNKGMN